MGRRPSLKYQFNEVLKSQEAYGESRHAMKKEHGHGHLDKIYSEKSFLSHQSRLFGGECNFIDYLKSQGVKWIDDVKEEHVHGFLEQKYEYGFEHHNQERGYSHRYLADTVSSINHVLHGKHEPYKISRDWEFEGYRGRINNRDDKERLEIPDKYNEQVDLARGFGLRRSEIEDVTTKSFYQDNEGRMYVSTIGKGGRPRVSACTEKYNDEMYSRYSDYVQKVDRYEDIPQSKHEIKASLSAGKEIYDDKIPSKYSTHIYRSEYANTYFEEVIKSGDYEHYGETATINDVMADKGAFLEVSKNLGHSRLYVMSSYIGSK